MKRFEYKNRRVFITIAKDNYGNEYWAIHIEDEGTEELSTSGNNIYDAVEYAKSFIDGVV